LRLMQRRCKVIKLKEKVNMAQLTRHIQNLADRHFKESYESDLCKDMYVAGALEMLRLVRESK